MLQHMDGMVIGGAVLAAFLLWYVWLLTRRPTDKIELRSGRPE